MILIVTPAVTQRATQAHARPSSPPIASKFTQVKLHVMRAGQAVRGRVNEPDLEPPPTIVSVVSA